MDGIDRGFPTITDLFQNVNIPPIIQTYRNSIVLWYLFVYIIEYMFGYSGMVKISINKYNEHSSSIKLLHLS